MAVTLEIFRAQHPQFDALLDSMVAAYLAQALVWVDGWISPDHGQSALACHMMTLDGLGSSPEAQAFAAGIGSLQSIRSGQLTITKREAPASSGGEMAEWLAQTQCGRFFAMMMRMERGGPRVACGGMHASQSGYAKDVPLPNFKWQGTGRE